MSAFTFYSKHSLQRIEQRSKISTEDLSLILDSGLVVNVGCEPGFDRQHLLFFSPDDNQCFVAIQDRYIGKVVTVLPLDYHENIAWKVSEEQCQKAQQKMQDFSNVKSASFETSPPKKVLLSALYLDENQKQKVKGLGKDAQALFDIETGQLVKEKGTFKRMCQFIKNAGLNPDIVYGLSVRLGKKGMPSYVEFA